MNGRQQPEDVDAELVDFETLAAWMDAQSLPRGRFEHVTPLHGGTQNVLLRFHRGWREYVLRRPPRHPRRYSNQALLREMRVLQALADTGVPHPRFLAGCADEQVMGGVVFYLMESVDGFNPTVELPAPHATDPGMRHAMGLRAVEALAALGRLDPDEVGLQDFGRPEGFLERQVDRWLRELDTYRDLPGYPGFEVPGLKRISDWLRRHQPRPARPGIMHGDFHLGNLLCSRTGPQIAAIVDWEMATLGDPLLDLGRFLAGLPTPEEPMGAVGCIYQAGSLPSRDELVAAYAAHSDRDLADLDWYVVLACFKLGIILEGTYARAFAGQAEKEVGIRLHRTTLALFGRALTMIT